MDYNEDTLRQVSLCISKELEKQGYGANKLKMQRSVINLLEYIENNDRQGQPLFNTGSNAEGVDVFGSDRDAMIVFPNVTVISNTNELNGCKISRLNHVFVMVQDGVQAGYTKLRLERQGERTDDLYSRLGGTETFCETDGDGHWYLSSQKFKEILSKHVSSSLDSTATHQISAVHLHGPCASFDNVVGITKFDVDFAYSLRCPYLPEEAEQWFTRKRKFNWPSDEILKSCETYGCDIVAIGDKTSPMSQLEWRISYARIERELVWSLNDTQCKCYVLLKTILKEYVDELAPEELSSYALKTMLFWFAEDTNETFWKEENLLNCTTTCLLKLLQCVNSKQLPHYVSPKNNILLTKFQDSTMHRKVIEFLTDTQTWHWSRFFNCRILSALQTLWGVYKIDVRSFLRYSRHANLKPMFYKDLISFRSLQTLYMSMNVYYLTVSKCQTLNELLEKAPECIDEDIVNFMKIAAKARLILNDSHTPETTEAIGKGVLMTENRRDELQTTSTTEFNKISDNKNQNIDSRRQNMNRCSKITSPDICTESLHMAVRYFMAQKYEAAEAELEATLSSFRPHSLYIGMCGPEEVGEDETLEYLCYVTSGGNLSLLEKAQQCLCLDFIVTKNDIVPPILQKEQKIWEENEVPICVHPRIMTYYLLVLTFYYQDRLDESKQCLWSLSMHVRFTDKRATLYAHIAWNMLGHCYLLHKKNKLAFLAFQESLKRKLLFNPALSLIGVC